VGFQRIPLIAQTVVEHPVAKEITTEFRAIHIDGTASPGNAVPAPLICRLVEVIDIGQSATKRATIA
jgi:hypothetical protein